MGMANVITGIGYITLGVITLLLSKLLSDRFLMPQKIKYKVLDKKRYLKSSRLLLFSLGIYYIVLGMILIIIRKESSIHIYFEIILPFLIYLPLIYIWKKQIRPLDKSKF